MLGRWFVGAYAAAGKGLKVSIKHRNNMGDDETYVTISLSRLKELEAAEENMKKQKDDIVKEYNKKRIEELHKKDKENPESVRRRINKYYDTHKEEIKAKRKEAYRKKKEEMVKKESE